MLEVARLLAGRRDALRRGIRFASGPGTRTSLRRPRRGTRSMPGASCISAASSISTSTRRRRAAPPTIPVLTRPRTPALRRDGRRRRHRPAEPWPALLARGAIKSFLGGPACRRRSCRSPACPRGHRSVTRHGAAGRKRRVFRGGGTRRDDTLDKIDADVLALDTKVYLASALRWLKRARAATRPRPRRPGACSSSSRPCRRPRRGAIRPGARGRPPRVRFVDRLDRVGGALAAVDAGTPAAKLNAINRGLMRLSRVLVPLSYTNGDRFTHDLALPIRRSPGSARARSCRRSIRHRRVQGSRGPRSCASATARFTPSIRPHRRPDDLWRQ